MRLSMGTGPIRKIEVEEVNVASETDYHTDTDDDIDAEQKAAKREKKAIKERERE